MQNGNDLDEALIDAWIRLTGVLKNTRITTGMIYNEAIVMNIAYRRFRETEDGLVSFREIVEETRMLKSLVNRTITSLVKKGYLERYDGKADRRTTYVRIREENIGAYLEVHACSLELARSMHAVIGDADAEAFVRISEKVAAADPLGED